VDIVAASKVLAPLLDPGNVLAVAILCVLIFCAVSGSKLGRMIAAVSAVILVLVTLLPIGKWSLAPLENRFAPPRLIPARIDGLLLLGGGESPALHAVRGTAAVVESEGRYVAARTLMERYPGARLVFSGTEASVAKPLVSQLGIDRRRTFFEEKARSTWENLVFAQIMVEPKPAEVWLLVAHAYQMPRAIGVARKLGWQLVPWPVDYYTGDTPGIGLQFTDNLYKLGFSGHEWLGLVAYRILGRTSSVFPSAKADRVSVRSAVFSEQP
jgi:uncharacterized SAM-binding protein YcdF (DUF218 family)